MTTQNIPSPQRGNFVERFGTSSFALFVLLYSTFLRISSVHADTPIHTDTPAFLQAVAMFRGEWHGAVAPFRIEYPVYPYLVYLTNHFVPDWLLAAKIAAFLPSVLIPLVVFAATLILSRDRYAALFAGFLAASSPTLLKIAAAPLYDSTFILTFALFLAGGFLFLKRPSWSTAALVGVLMGLSSASRGLGLFLIIPYLCGIACLRELPALRKWGFSALGVIFLFVVAALIKVPAKIAMGSLPEDQTNCLKEVMADGMRYAEGQRDQIVYRLNADATALQLAQPRPCELSWRQFASHYYKDEIKSFIVNLRRIIVYDLVDILMPFMVFFVPLTLGLSSLMNRERLPDAVFIAATFASFVVMVSAIQYQDRYLYPLVVLVAIIAGVGCSLLYGYGTRGRFALVAILLIAFVGGTDLFRHAWLPDEAETNYRKACEWILARDGTAFSFGVMERHHGIYAHLKRGLVMMPVDEPDRVRHYADVNDVKYVIGGPDERNHNPQLFQDARFLKELAEFGSGVDSVGVFEISSNAGEPALDHVETGGSPGK